MRLTLRTMLAYLDGILDPADSQALGKKIADSEYATNLVQRVRDLTRRPRLGAPKIEGRGLGLDANSVAEYLDNTMPPDKVPEFERICLESDVHLAEVASSHQILTMVLGEPAEIEPGMRERMYRVSSETKASADRSSSDSLVGASASGVGATAELDQPTPKRKTAEAPEYLKETRRRPIWPLVSTAAVALAVTVVALLAMGKLDQTHPVYRLVFGGHEIANAPTDPSPKSDSPKSDSPESKLPESDSPEFNSPGPLPSQVRSSASNHREDGQANGRPVERESLPDRDSPPTEETRDVPSGNEVRRPEASTRDNTDESPRLKPVPTETPTLEPATTPADTSPTEPTEVRPPAGRNDRPETTGKSAAEKGKPGSQGTATAKPRANTPGIEKPNADPSGIAGRFISDSQVLAVWNNKTESWARMGTGTTLKVQDRLLSLPIFRPQMLLSPGFNVTFAGPSYCVIGEPDAEGWPALVVGAGRFSISTDGKPDMVMHFDLAGRELSLQFKDADSAVAIEVLHHLPMGADPLKQRAQIVISVHAAKGKVAWQDATQNGVLTAGQAVSFIDDSPGEPLGGSLPDWTDPRSAKLIFVGAARQLEELISTDRPLDVSLLERSEHRHNEVRALAIQSLAHLEIFEPLINALKDETQHPFWPTMMDTIQLTLSKSPETAAKFQTALMQTRPVEGARLYRLCCGYNQEQLAAGGAKELVGDLENKSMDVRVLALENLRRITGKTKLFRPEKPAEQQKRPLREWRDALDNGEITHKAL